MCRQAKLYILASRHVGVSARTLLRDLLKLWPLTAVLAPSGCTPSHSSRRGRRGRPGKCTPRRTRSRFPALRPREGWRPCKTTTASCSRRAVPIATVPRNQYNVRGMGFLAGGCQKGERGETRCFDWCCCSMIQRRSGWQRKNNPHPLARGHA